MTHGAGRGFLLTFEGIDGAGKSSHLSAVREYFEKVGRRVVMTREPGGTPLAEALRSVILHDAMDALTEVLIIFAARRDHVVNVIEPALKAGSVVVSDRFTDSTFAYQGAGRGFQRSVLQSLEDWTLDGLQPDLTLWFDISPSVAAARLRDARQPDRFEGEQLAFFERVRSGYSERATLFPSRFRRIDAEGTQDEIWKRIESVLANAAETSP